MKRFDIECGASQTSTPDAIAMDVQGPAQNVNLRIDYISRSMLGNVPDILIDLLEVAAYVYCADQRLGRGSDKLTRFGEDWRRSLNFSIPVRCFDIWQQIEIHEFLAETLGFLSDDSYAFSFRRAETPSQPKERYFPDLIDTLMTHDEIALFSGGVDSFAGTVDDIVKHGKSIALVGHYSSTKVRNVQSSLIDELKRRGFERKISYIPVWVTNQGVSAKEYTQRTRSFLFACLGLVVARMSGKDGFNFYENGVVSINLPLAGDVIGGRATRTTHPRVLRGLEGLFSTLLDQPIKIRTPLQWLTKKEVTLKIRDAGMADMLAMTSSCTRPRMWTKKQKHCGVCSQCIDRRFGVLAAGMEEFEPSANYMSDLLLSDRSANDDMRMALSHVSLFQRILATPKNRFIVEFPEVVSAIDRFDDLSADEAISSLYDLFQRHALAVQDVITTGLAQNAEALFRNELPAGSLLSTCFSRGYVEAASASDCDAQAKAFVDRLSAPILEFAIDASGKRVVFRDGSTLEGANFSVVHAMIGNYRKAKAEDWEVPFLPTTSLAASLKIDEQSLRQQLSRLRKAIEPLNVSLGVPLGNDTFIETKERAGYRLNPELRELSLSDIRVANPILPHA